MKNLSNFKIIIKTREYFFTNTTQGKALSYDTTSDNFHKLKTDVGVLEFLPFHIDRKRRIRKLCKNIRMKEINLPSEHGNLRGVVWDDVQSPIGTVQIAHGLAEYHGRYVETANFLNSAGYIVYCNDHLGHGLHISDGKLKGYFKEKGGYDAVVDQLAEMNLHVRKENTSLNHYILSYRL